LKKILLVNNLPGFLERNTTLLNRIGFKIYTATTVLEAIRIHRAHKVNLIIAMLEMPETGGDRLCSLIRQDSELRKVSILLICQPTPGQIEKASQCGANAWICKPVQPGLLLQEVGKLIAIPTRLDHRTSIHGIVRCRWFSGISRNISVSGILCETDVQIDPEEVITDMSVFVRSREIIADGRVARAVNLQNGLYNYGVQFIGLAPEHRQEIATFIAHNELTA
jgi:CheY-like chemotaxis protein